MKENLIKLLSEEKILPILRSNDAQTVIDWANALIEGGIKILEVNVQNPSIYKAIEEISKHAAVCAGGIITAMQAEASIVSGAKVLSSPIFSKNLVKISLVNGTLPHEYTTNFGSSKVILKPAVEGTGVIAGGAVRPVLELAGVKNVTAKTLGSRNSRNVVYATIKALKAMRTPEEVAELRDKTVTEILK